MEPLDSILEQLRSKFETHSSSPVSDLDGKPNNLSVANTPISSTSNSLDDLLSELRKSNHSTSEVQSHRYSQAIAKDLQEISHQQKLKDFAQFSKVAEAWLEKLDPLCGEGLWFEEFAKNYPSRLEAAIALLSHK